MEPREVLGHLSQRWPDGRVELTVREAAEVWCMVGAIAMTAGIYRRQCKSGEMQARGIAISEGPRYMTDLDSLLAFFDRELTGMRGRLDGLMEERRRDLGGG